MTDPLRTERERILDQEDGLAAYTEGQWWIVELDRMVDSFQIVGFEPTFEQKRAVAVCHRFIRDAHAAVDLIEAQAKLLERYEAALRYLADEPSMVYGYGKIARDALQENANG